MGPGLGEDQGDLEEERPQEVEDHGGRPLEEEALGIPEGVGLEGGFQVRPGDHEGDQEVHVEALEGREGDHRGFLLEEVHEGVQVGCLAGHVGGLEDHEEAQGGHEEGVRPLLLL